MSTTDTASLFAGLQSEASSASERDIVEPNLSVEVVDSPEEIEFLGKFWRSWALTLDSDLDYFLHKVKTDPSILRPHVITVYESGVPQTILVGMVKERRVSAVVSYVQIRGPKARVLEIVHGGRLGRQSAAIDKLIAHLLFQTMKHGHVDLLCFHRLALNSQIFREVQQLPDLIFKERVPHRFCYSVLSLTPVGGSRPAIFSGKIRREARRKLRILQRAFAGRVRFQCFSEPAELDLGIRDATSVSRTTWQHSLGDGLEGVQQQSLSFGARRGWLRVYVLYIDEKPSSFLLGQLYGKSFYCQNTGYNPEFAQFSIGSVLTAWALEDLAAIGVQQVDLGEGSQEHNRRLRCNFCEEGTVHVYSPTLRGLLAGLFVGTTQMVRTAGRRARFGLLLKHFGPWWLSLPMKRPKSDSVCNEAPKV